MKNGMPEHYWRIHARVARRILTDMPTAMRESIANDFEHTTENYQWFERRVNEGATRLFEDGNYYDNAQFSFTTPREQRPRHEH